MSLIDYIFRAPDGKRSVIQLDDSTQYAQQIELRYEGEDLLFIKQNDVFVNYKDYRSVLSRVPKDSFNLNANPMASLCEYFDKQKLVVEDYPEGKFSGRGIVTLAGTKKYYICGYAMVYVLRKLGCKLPIEVHYLGDKEMDFYMKRLMEELGDVKCVDLNKRLTDLNLKPRCWGGWQAKSWGITYSEFEEVLFLDSDNVPAVDPEYLFETKEYLEAGAILWPDLENKWGLDITKEAFEIFGLPVPTKFKLPRHHNPTDYRPVESGQLLINKRKHWNTLRYINRINDYSDYFYPSPRGKAHWLFYGDKSTFYLGFNALKQPYFMPKGCDFHGDSKAGGFIQYDPEGKVVFQHKCQPVGKLKLSNNVYCDKFLHNDLLEEAVQKLACQWDGVVWGSCGVTSGEMETAHQLAGSYSLYSERKSIFTKDPNTRYNVTLAPNGVVPEIKGGWRVLHHRGETIVVLVADDIPFFLTKDPFGNWCNYEEGIFLTSGPPHWWRMGRDKFDIVVWTEVVTNNEYELPKFMNGMTVLDIGGHVGTFAYACLERGCSKVISVEPNPQNFEFLRLNMRQYGERSIVLNKAVWPEDYITLRLSQPEGAKHSAGWSVEGNPTNKNKDDNNFFEAVTVSLDKIREYPRQGFDLCKMDCEGAEWDLLEKCDFSHIHEICGEYHLANTGYTTDYLKQLLEKQGFPYVTLKPNPGAPDTLGLFFAKRGVEEQLPVEIEEWLK